MLQYQQGDAGRNQISVCSDVSRLAPSQVCVCVCGGGGGGANPASIWEISGWTLTERDGLQGGGNTNA